MRGGFLSLTASLALLRTVSAVSVVSGGVEYIGRISGNNGTQTQEVFLSIPYAKAPRFERPGPATVSSPFNATAYGPICPQATPLDPSIGLVESEDCLTLDIFRPTGSTPQSSYPVMLFIYGGSYSNGVSAFYPMDLLGDIANTQLGKPIIGVVMNYRTGVYGFPVGAKAQANNALNLGLYDQRAAIEWVKSHVADFGGNPSKVTLFGHSAGGVSVGLQMLYNGGQIGGGFQRALMQSGSPNTLAVQPPSTPAREAAYNYLVKQTGCASSANTFACLKTASFATFNAAHVSVYEVNRTYEVIDYPWSTFTPAVSAGDKFLPITPYNAIKQGKFAKIPIVDGTTLDEGTIFVPVKQTQEEYVDWFTLAVPGSDIGFSDAADKPIIRALVKSVYSSNPADGSPYGTGANTFGTSPFWKQATSIAGDIQFESSRRFFLREAVKAGVSAWSYRWVQPINVTDFPPMYGVSHVQDIYAEFRNFGVTPEGLDTGVKFIDYLTSFAYGSTGDITPALPGLPAWTKYNAAPKSLQLKYNDYKMISDNYRSTEIDYIINNLLPIN